MGRRVAEMRTRQEVDRVMALRAEGLNACEIGHRTGIPRGTVRDWLAGRVAAGADRPRPAPAAGGAAPLRRLRRRQLGERRPISEVSLQQSLPRYPGDLWAAFDALGIQWRPHNRVSLPVARRASVALLDEFVESKQ
jgi:hypothetical protein